MITFTKPDEANTWLEKFTKVITREKEKKATEAKKETDLKKENTELDKWTREEITLLTKAILKYPAGMGSRWEQIAKFIGGKKSVQAVTQMVTDLKCKNLKGPDAIMRQIEKMVSENEAKNAKIEEKKAEIKEDGPKTVEWTQEEQNLLQKAMKEFPASMEAGERWGKIAEKVGGGKTKKDCLNRVKEIKAKMTKK